MMKFDSVANISVVHPDLVRPDAYLNFPIRVNVVGGATTRLEQAEVTIQTRELRRRCVVAVDPALKADTLLGQDFKR